MGKNSDTSLAVDILLTGMAVGTVTGAMLVAPNAIQMLEKPLEKLFKKLDQRQKMRRISQLRSYLKTQGLVRGDYEHGIELTKKAMARIKKYQFNSLVITQPDKWDRKWHLVMFDIPEIQHAARAAFTEKIHLLGFQLLQQSVWIHPFECKSVVYIISDYYGVDKWVTYIQTDHIDNDIKLLKRFKNLLS